MSTVLWKIQRIQEILGHDFHDAQLIKSAITHPSATENKPIWASYERLEFLGDSVVGMVVAEELFERFPDMDEGELSRLKLSLISGESMAAVARERGIDEVIIFGQSERGTGARGLRSALENVYEAVTGALYLDAGMEKARAWIIDTLQPHLAPWRSFTPENPKSLLQEKTQADRRGTPSYELVRELGPAHEPTFVCQCLVGEQVVGEGSGTSKKTAESAAAADALVRLGYIKAPAAEVSFDPDQPWPPRPLDTIDPR